MVEGEAFFCGVGVVRVRVVVLALVLVLALILAVLVLFRYWVGIGEGLGLVCLVSLVSLCPGLDLVLAEIVLVEEVLPGPGFGVPG